MFKFFSYLLITLLAQTCHQVHPIADDNSSSIQPTTLVKLPKSLNESSGLVVLENKIYSINDHGGKAELFMMDVASSAHKKIKITNVKNHDWEALAANDTYFFIGDFGNNDGDRNNLSLHYFPITLLENTKIEAQTIHFEYANPQQHLVQPLPHAYDAEAMIAIKNEVIIFTKDRANYTTQVYHLPLESKGEIVKIVSSENMQMDALITGASYDEHLKRLVLCGYNHKQNFLWIFEKATPHKLLLQPYKKIYLATLDHAQVEGVAFLNENQVLISTEKTKKFTQQLWVVNINN